MEEFPQNFHDIVMDIFVIIIFIWFMGLAVFMQ